MDKDTIILWELIQFKIANLEQLEVVLLLNTDEKLGFIIDVDKESYVLETLNEVKAFISGIEISISLKLAGLVK